MMFIAECRSLILDLDFFHPGSRTQGSKKHWIPDLDPQHFIFVFLLRIWDIFSQGCLFDIFDAFRLETGQWRVKSTGRLMM